MRAEGSGQLIEEVVGRGAVDKWGQACIRLRVMLGGGGLSSGPCVVMLGGGLLVREGGGGLSSGPCVGGVKVARGTPQVGGTG